MHATSNGKSLGFSTRQGKIERIGKTTAHVKLRNNRREWVSLTRLRKEGQKTELTEMIQEMASEDRTEGSAKTAEERADLEGNFERRIHGGLPRAETERHADLQVVRDTDTAQGNLGAHAREASLRPQRRAKVRHTLDGLS